jgi:hypothetical protein
MMSAWSTTCVSGARRISKANSTVQVQSSHVSILVRYLRASGASRPRSALEISKPARLVRKSPRTFFSEARSSQICFFCLHSRFIPTSSPLEIATHSGFRLLAIKHIASTSAGFKDIGLHTLACVRARSIETGNQPSGSMHLMLQRSSPC